ncbi:hypothetical protein Gotur_002208 [Gossypium turneri]
MVNLHNVGTINTDKGFKVGYLNDHKEASQFKHLSFAYYDQFTAIYAKDRATGKDAQTTADIIEEIDVEDVTTTNIHEETIFMDAKLMFLLMIWISQLHNHNHLETKMIPHFQKRKKKISDASEQISSTLFTDAATLFGENIRTVGLEISRSIASEVLIQQKSKMVIQESALTLYPTLCKVEGLTEDERYRALSKIPDHLM